MALFAHSVSSQPENPPLRNLLWRTANFTNKAFIAVLVVLVVIRVIPVVIDSNFSSNTRDKKVGIPAVTMKVMIVVISIVTCSNMGQEAAPAAPKPFFI